MSEEKTILGKILLGGHKMIGENNLLILDVREISMEDITILQKAVNEINKYKVKIKSTWIDNWDKGLIG